MKCIASVLALTTSALPALAQSSNNPGANSPKVTVPSGQNSGAGIHGYSGNKNGPSAKSGTVGSATGNQNNSAAREQDPAKIKGLPGNKSGPPAKPQ